MGWLVGDSYGGIQAAENAEDSNRRMALASAMNSATQAMQFSKTDQRHQDEMEAQKEQFAKNYALAVRGQRLAQEKNDWEQMRDVSKDRLGEKYYDLYNRQFDWQKTQGTPTQNREHDLTFGRAVQDADTGTFEDPDEVAHAYPSLSPTEHNIIASRSNESRRNIEANFTLASHVAGTLNKHADLTSQFQALDDRIKKGTGHIWNSSDVGTATAEQKQVQAQLAPVASAANAIHSDKRLGEMISFDPEAGKYVPAVAVPKWLAPKAPVTGTAKSRPATDAGASSLPGPGSGTRTGSTGRKYDPWIYSRVNELHAMGMDPASALQRSIQEYQSVFGQ